MSAGVASLQQHRAASVAAILNMADQALYRAKSLGKSQISVYRPGRAPAVRGEGVAQITDQGWDWPQKDRGAGTSGAARVWLLTPRFFLNLLLGR